MLGVVLVHSSLDLLDHSVDLVLLLELLEDIGDALLVSNDVFLGEHAV